MTLSNPKHSFKRFEEMLHSNPPQGKKRETETRPATKADLQRLVNYFGKKNAGR